MIRWKKSHLERIDMYIVREWVSSENESRMISQCECSELAVYLVLFVVIVWWRTFAVLERCVNAGWNISYSRPALTWFTWNVPAACLGAYILRLFSGHLWWPCMFNLVLTSLSGCPSLYILDFFNFFHISGSYVSEFLYDGNWQLSAQLLRRTFSDFRSCALKSAQTPKVRFLI